MVDKSNKNRPRKEYVYARTRDNISRLEVSINKDGSIDFGEDAISVYTQLEYEREKGSKVINRIFQSGSLAFFDHDEALSNSYDKLMAVDTNTRLVNGVKISVTGIVIGQKVWIPEEDSLDCAWQFFTPFCIEIHDVSLNPERFGWVAALEQLYVRKLIDVKDRHGMIVDAFMNDLSKINSRNEEIVPGSYLWKNITLIYASSDVGAENFANKIIRLADKASSKCLELIESGIVPMMSEEVNGCNYKRMRLLLGKARGV